MTTTEIRCAREQLAGSFALHPPVKSGADHIQRQHRLAVEILTPASEPAPVEALAWVLDWAREQGMHGLENSIPIEGEALTGAAYKAGLCVGFSGELGTPSREYAVWSRLPTVLFSVWAASQGVALARELGWPADWHAMLAAKLT